MSLNGDQINITSNPTLPGFNLTGVTVGPGVEASFTSGIGSTASLDVDEDSFTIEYTAGFLGTDFIPVTFTLSDLDWVDDTKFITAVTATDGSGITPTFTPDSIVIPVPSTPFPSGPGSTVTYSFDITTECFLPGTRILTDHGEINVEGLAIGDLVKTADGFQAIKWIGKQTVDPTRVKSALRSHPICVKAGALGNNLPQRDLYISPDHALLIEGLLINAGALVNGTSIIKTEPTETFTYYHIELDAHALMVVEGTYAESYLPQKEDRHCYDNSDEFDSLYPGQCNMILWPLDYPRVSSTTTVPRYIRKHLNIIADALLAEDLQSAQVALEQDAREVALQLI